MRYPGMFILGAGLLLGHVAPAAAQSVARGKTIFESVCGACHSLDANRVGPALRGVLGRPAGTAPDFAYSVALGRARHTWDRTKINAWLSNPEKLVPGQAMNFQMEQAKDRADVVAYLATQKATRK